MIYEHKFHCLKKYLSLLLIIIIWLATLEETLIIYKNNITLHSLKLSQWYYFKKHIARRRQCFFKISSANTDIFFKVYCNNLQHRVLVYDMFFHRFFIIDFPTIFTLLSQSESLPIFLQSSQSEHECLLKSSLNFK